MIVVNGTLSTEVPTWEWHTATSLLSLAMASHRPGLILGDRSAVLAKACKEKWNVCVNSPTDGSLGLL